MPKYGSYIATTMTPKNRYISKCHFVTYIYNSIYTITKGLYILYIQYTSIQYTYTSIYSMYRYFMYIYSMYRYVNKPVGDTLQYTNLKTS